MNFLAKIFKRIQRPVDDESSSSDDEKESITTPKSSLSNSIIESDIELSETDDENEPVINNRSRKVESFDDIESDEEDNRRKTIYQAESDEDEKPPIEDQWALRKSIRKSINPLDPELNDSESSDDDDDSDVIIASDDEVESSSEVAGTDEEGSFLTENLKQSPNNKKRVTLPLQSNKNLANFQANKTLPMNLNETTDSSLNESQIEDKENSNPTSPPNLSNNSFKNKSITSEVETENESLNSSAGVEEVEKKYQFKTHSVGSVDNSLNSENDDVVDISEDEVVEVKEVSLYCT
jgi:hypothetical protein